MKTLETFNLANNQLKCLFTGTNAETTFKGLKHLRYIYISGNNLGEISESVFKDQTELQVLIADGKTLSHFSPDLFRFTKNLNFLDLSDNKSSVLKEGSMKYLQNLQMLNMANNPFSYDCALRWFRGWMDRTKVLILKADTYKCNGPNEWHRKRLLDFNGSKINCTFFSKYDIIGAVCRCICVYSFVSRACLPEPLETTSSFLHKVFFINVFHVPFYIFVYIFVHVPFQLLCLQ